jgi:hypothetical protein
MSFVDEQSRHQIVAQPPTSRNLLVLMGRAEPGMLLRLRVGGTTNDADFVTTGKIDHHGYSSTITQMGYSSLEAEGYLIHSPEIRDRLVLLPPASRGVPGRGIGSMLIFPKAPPRFSPTLRSYEKIVMMGRPFFSPTSTRELGPRKAVLLRKAVMAFSVFLYTILPRLLAGWVSRDSRSWEP